MAAALDISPTATPSLLDLLRTHVPAEHRAATDYMPLDLWVALEGPVFVDATSIVALEQPVEAAASDPWLIDTLSAIERFRGYSDGWDGDVADAPTPASLEAAELLAAFLLSLPDAYRPSLSLDVLGRPTFALNNGSLYLHLTVDPDATLTWYAVANGQEHFEADVAFDATELPAGLRRVFPQGRA